MQVIKFTPIPKKARFSLELIRLLADWDQNKIPPEVFDSQLANLVVTNMVKVARAAKNQ